MPFEFASAGRIVFGAGTHARLPELAKGFGERVLLVTGKNPDRFPQIEASLRAAGLEPVGRHPIEGEPTVEDAEAGAELAKTHRATFILAVGGGSAVDAGKAIAALATNDGAPLDYLEVIGRGQSLEAAPLPFIAVPTTAGTGSEVTKNAVLSSKAHRVKVSLRSNAMLPNVALVDPELTLTLPPAVTADCGLDALAQVVEPYVSHLATPLTDAICQKAIPMGARSLVKAFQQGDDLEARTDMAFTSLSGGLALANAKLGAVHGFAGPLGGMFGAPHGAICGRLLPFVTQVNARALSARLPEAPYLERYREVARMLCGDPEATIEDGVKWLLDTAETLGARPLSAYGVTAQDFEQIIEKSAKSSSMRGNPIELTASELTEILEAAT